MFLLLADMNSWSCPKNLKLGLFPKFYPRFTQDFPFFDNGITLNICLSSELILAIHIKKGNLEKNSIRHTTSVDFTWFLKPHKVWIYKKLLTLCLPC